jgi:hypothetical protein
MNKTIFLNFTKKNKQKTPEGEIIVGITARSILEFFGIPWNYMELFLEFLENLHKIPLEFLELLWNYCTIRNFNYFPLVNSQNLHKKLPLVG